MFSPEIIFAAHKIIFEFFENIFERSKNICALILKIIFANGRRGKGNRDSENIFERLRTF